MTPAALSFRHPVAVSILFHEFSVLSCSTATVRRCPDLQRGLRLLFSLTRVARRVRLAQQSMICFANVLLVWTLMHRLRSEHLGPCQAFPSFWPCLPPCLFVAFSPLSLAACRLLSPRFHGSCPCLGLSTSSATPCCLARTVCGHTSVMPMFRQLRSESPRLATESAFQQSVNSHEHHATYLVPSLRPFPPSFFMCLLESGHAVPEFFVFANGLNLCTSWCTSIYATGQLSLHTCLTYAHILQKVVARSPVEVDIFRLVQKYGAKCFFRI